jgi:hypothetical protein
VSKKKQAALAGKPGGGETGAGAEISADSVPRTPPGCQQENCAAQYFGDISPERARRLARLMALRYFRGRR